MSELKTKKPIYKKWWFWVIIAVLALWILSAIAYSINNSNIGNNNQTIDQQKSDQTKTDETQNTSTSDETPTAKEQTMDEKLEEKLSATNAITACEQHGKQQYPYGFTIHHVTGKIIEQALDENTWQFIYRVKINNAYDAEIERTMDCYVAGTSAAPEITNFNIRDN